MAPVSIIESSSTTKKRQPLEIFDLKSPSDWECRPNFLPALEGTADDLVRILGKYDLPRPAPGLPYGTGMVRCGLNGCNNLHFKGCLLLLKSGKETIVGRDCSREKMGAVWEEIEATFAATETLLARQKLLSELQQSKDAILKDANTLAPLCKEAHERIASAATELSGFPGFWRALEGVARLDGRVMVQAEHSSMTEHGPTADLVEAARIANCHLFFADTSIHSRRLYVQVIHWLESDLANEIADAGDDLKKLGALTVKAADLRDHLREAKTFPADARILLDRNNLAGLQVIVSKQLSSSHRSNALHRALRRLTAGDDSKSS